MNIVLTSYFTTLPDPQRDINWSGNNFEKIRDFYMSVKRFGLRTIIFHDHCNNEFIRKYTTSRIRFEYYKPDENLLNARLRCYYNYLKIHKRITNVFCLDIGDIILFHNPFRLIDKHKIYCGSEKMKIAESGYVVNDFRDSYGEIYYPDKKILNCGIIGGNRKYVVFVLEKMVAGFNMFKTDKNIDMAIFNKVMYDNFKESEIMTGEPLHTEFRQNITNPQKCYIKHK